MNFSEETYQQIHDYLNDQLSETAREVFDQRMSEEPELEEEVKLNQLMYENLGEPGEYASSNLKYSSSADKYRDFISSAAGKAYREAIAKAKPETTTTKSISWFYYAAAASVLLFLFAIILWVFNKPEPSLEQFYAWSELPSLTERSGDSRVAQAESYFRNNEYARAHQEFVEQIKIAPENASLYIYAGISLLELKQYDASIQQFDQLLEADLLDSNKGHWYKALVYLKMGENQLALTELEMILTNPDFFFQEDAKALYDIISDE